jgi:Na+-translocating ferredoxin:NAD+ oxidoreductase RnfC subunit
MTFDEWWDAHHLASHAFYKDYAREIWDAALKLAEPGACVRCGLPADVAPVVLDPDALETLKETRIELK